MLNSTFHRAPLSFVLSQDDESHQVLQSCNGSMHEVLACSVEACCRPYQSAMLEDARLLRCAACPVSIL
jgi:hypothetical protein